MPVLSNKEFDKVSKRLKEDGLDPPSSPKALLRERIARFSWEAGDVVREGEALSVEEEEEP